MDLIFIKIYDIIDIIMEEYIIIWMEDVFKVDITDNEKRIRGV